MATQQPSELASEGSQLSEGVDSKSDQLWVEISVQRPNQPHCPVANFHNTDVRGDIQLVGNRCHVSIQREDQTEGTQIITSTIEESCICASVCKPGISPANLCIESGALVLEAYVASHDRLQHLSDRLHDTAGEWQLRKLQSVAEHSPSEPEIVDTLSEEISLTTKQEEAIRLAVTRGYYANPREASLGTLAEEIGVSKAALSQRLNAVEAKLVDTLAEEL